MPAALIILLITLVTIAFRQVGKMSIPIWLIMATGAFATLVFQQITPLQAILAIEPNVMIYLFGVFLIAQAAEESGYLEHLTHRLFYYSHTGKQALVIIIFVLGLSTVLLMNDTIAIIGTPLILQLCKSQRPLIKPLLFALAFSITIGSAMSPVGNPQNLLIAVKGEMSSPFLDFIRPLIIPTLLNLFICYFLIYLVYKETLDAPLEKVTPTPISEHRTVLLVRISLMIMVFLVLAKIVLDSIHSPLRINFSYIAILAALPLFLSHQIWFFIKKLDWGTLIFFASTFVLMQSVWDSGFFQRNINHYNIAFMNPAVILLLSIVLSQFISNVPLVALYLPLLTHHSYDNSQLLTLAIGSTISGNLSILGAASNIIIIQNSENRGVKGFGFFEFIKLGAPLTLITILIYSYFL
ncbi:arsenite efflux membrane component-like protein [Legionella nautarum]|uniref:Arsenite efflux membrane component-like protein n=1 Tax=Legionella nautarum TaxID=45070 RepID=A0A0W0WWY0_9GAMM|nr:anion transporter [Legionella nautarum]KTD36811.1 arsenite efflux membrane component-like protein [Legionella nautarum]